MKRLCSTIMAVLMLFSLSVTAFPVYALDEENEQTQSCICTEKCTDEKINTECPVCAQDSSLCVGQQEENDGADESTVQPQCAGLAGCVDGVHDPLCPLYTVPEDESDGADESDVQPQAQCAGLAGCVDGAHDPLCPLYTAPEEESDGADESDVQPQNVLSNAPTAKGLPTENAQCSYTDKSGTTSTSPVSLSDAVAALNQAGGGTITVTTSGLAGANNIPVQSDITIVAQEGTPVTITAMPPADENDAVFLIGSNSSDVTLTLGQDGMSDGLLTFTGADQENSCIVERNSQYYNKIPVVVLQDGVTLTGCKRMAIGCKEPKPTLYSPDVEIHGGKISGNNGKAAVVARSFVMNGGEICGNTSEEATVDLYDDAIIEGNAWIHENTAGKAGGVKTIGALIVRGEAKVENCHGTDPKGGFGGLYAVDLELSGNAIVQNCTSSVIGGCGAMGDVILKDAASIQNCTATGSTEPGGKVIGAGGIWAYGNITVEQGAKITGCSGPVGGILSAKSRWIANSVSEILIRGTVSGNRGYTGGGVAAYYGARVTLDSTAQVTGNSATKWGGGVSILNIADASGKEPGKLEDTDKVFLVIQPGATVRENTAPVGGGVFVAGSAETKELVEEIQDEDVSGEPGPCIVTLAGGTITGNRAANPEGGTAAEFQGGGMYLGWDVETSISGTVNISGNTDAEGKASNLYLSMTPDRVGMNPEQYPQELLTQFVKDHADEYIDESIRQQIYDTITAKTDDELKTALLRLGLVEEEENLSRTQMEEKLKSYVDPMILASSILDSMDKMETMVTSYREAGNPVPLYTEYYDWVASVFLDDYMVPSLLFKQVVFQSETVYRQALTAMAQASGVVAPGTEYTGTLPELIPAYAFYFWGDLRDNGVFSDDKVYELYTQLFGDSARWPSSFDARLQITGSLAGSNVNITAEGACRGRVLAVGADGYTVTDDDLNVLISNDYGYIVARNATDSNKLELARTPLEIKPADVTIYMGGANYAGTVDKDGNIISDSTVGFPTPGFTVTLSDYMKEQNVSVEDDLTLEYQDGDNLYTWKFEKYGTGSKDIYRIVPDEGTQASEVAIRFTDAEGNDVNGETLDFADYLNKSLTMEVYGKGIEPGTVKAVFGDTFSDKSSILAGTGNVTVRGTTDEVYSAKVEQAAENYQPQEAGKPGVTVPAGTVYAINGSEVLADPDQASIALLFDNIIEANRAQDTSNTQLLTDRAQEILDGSDVALFTDPEQVRYEFRYLDLVDSNNGNVWVKAQDAQGNPVKVKVYWPVPEDAQEDDTFVVLHFEGVHRSMGVESIAQEIDTCNVTVEKCERQGNYIVFETDGFSPYGLAYGAGVPTAGPDDEPDDEKDDTDDKTETGTTDADNDKTGSESGQASAQNQSQASSQATVSAAGTDTMIPAAVAAVIPQTGDASHPIVWVVLLCCSAAVLGGLIWYKRKHTKE